MNNIEIERKYQVISMGGRPMVSDAEAFQLLAQALKDQGLKDKSRGYTRDIYWDNDDYELMNLKRGLRTRSDGKRPAVLEFKSLFASREGKNIVEEVGLNPGNVLNVAGLEDILVRRMGVVNNEDFVKIVREGGYRQEGKGEAGKEGAMAWKNDAEEVLRALGLKEKLIVEKSRIVVVNEKGNIEVMVDDVKGLPLHVEFEISGGGERELLEWVEDIKMKLELELFDQGGAGYADLLAEAAVPGRLSWAEMLGKYEEKFDWNVRPGEEEIVKGLFRDLEEAGK